MHTITLPLVTFVLGLGAVGITLDTKPDVDFNRTAGKCVEVKANNPVYDCNKLPAAYKKHWVND